VGQQGERGNRFDSDRHEITRIHQSFKSPALPGFFFLRYGKGMKQAVLVRTATPYLCVHEAEKALTFYQEAFGAQMVGEPVPYEGKIGHAVLRLGECTIFLADEFPRLGVQSPTALGACTCTIVLTVDDVDAFIERARGAGATITQEPIDESYGRTAKLSDPFGQRWIISSRI
jgi:PhnB protein